MMRLNNVLNAPLLLKKMEDAVTWSVLIVSLNFAGFVDINWNIFFISCRVSFICKIFFVKKLISILYLKEIKIR